MQTDWATVVPAKGEEKATIKLLLSLADHSSHVRSQAPGSELLIPPYLADRFTESTQPKPQPRPRRPKKEDEQ